MTVLASTEKQNKGVGTFNLPIEMPARKLVYG